MNFFALLGALILTHYWPHTKMDLLQQYFAPYAHLLERTFNGGKSQHSAIAWLLGALLPALVSGALYYWLLKIHVVLGILFSLCTLYFVLRFSHFCQPAEQITVALRNNDVNLAREIYSSWEGVKTTRDNATNIARKSIEVTLERAHHGLFAPIFWFVVLGLMCLGPAGALLYRLSHLLKLEWHLKQDNRFNNFSSQAFEWLDWLPTRITAGSFAAVGDFEDAVFCWRTQAESWSDKALGILLASGAGALGVRLGEKPDRAQKNVTLLRPELGLDEEADADYLQSAVALVWRVLILMAGLLLLLNFAHWLGS